MYAFQPAAFRAASYPVLQSAGLHIPLFLPGQHIGIRVQRLPFPAELCHLSVQRNDADGGAALGYTDQNLCFSAFCASCFICALCLSRALWDFCMSWLPHIFHILQPLHAPADAECLMRKRDVRPAQGADLSDSQACQQSQQHAEPAAVHILQQIFCKTALFFRGEDPHLLPVFPGINDVDRLHGGELSFRIL